MDSRSEGFGEVLSQVKDNQERVIAHFSKVMNKAERTRKYTNISTDKISTSAQIDYCTELVDKF
jgi:hypothetical protein